MFRHPYPTVNQAKLDSRVLSYLLVAFVICTTVRQLYLRSADSRQPTESTHQERIRWLQPDPTVQHSLNRQRNCRELELRAANSPRLELSSPGIVKSNALRFLLLKFGRAHNYRPTPGRFAVQLTATCAIL